MNNVLSALCGTVNFMPPWIMLIVFGAIILLMVLVILLKGVKRLFFRLIIYALVAAMVVAYLAYLCVQIAMWDDLIEIIAFAIGWLPTILFTIGVIIAVLRGIRRGLRKSLILALHAACAGAVCVAFFFLMVYVKEVDAGALKFVNWLGGENALQNLLGVSEDCSTLKEVLAAYIVTIPGVGFGALSPYVYTLVDMAYRIIFGILSCLLFFAIDFILYIVYVLCYSQRKYKKNKNLEFQNGKTDRSYNKHWIGGGIVGFVRGVATGLLCLSFLGSAFFVVAGGKGEGKLEDHDFGNEELNFYYQIYRSVESYGAQGIFQILNAMTDANDTPYYLFAADLVFSGELNDEEFGISENVKFREELGAFTGFARDTFDLLIKYGPDEVNAIVNGETEGAFDTLVDIMTSTGFKEEFDSLIDAFDAQTYIINLSMALVNTIVSNIDDIEFTKDAVGAGEKELIKLIFKKGFLTDNIPDERDLMKTTGLTEAEGEDIRPYLTVNHILNKNDVKLVLNVVLSLLAGDETGDTLQLVKRIVPEMGKLSILGTRRKDEVNPILGRMYCLFENLYLTADGEDGVTYSEINEDGIDWIGEIHKLFDSVDDTVLIYNNVSEADLGEEADAIDILKYLFNEESAKYKENMAAYDHICGMLTESPILGRALATNFVYKTIHDALTGLFADIYLPRDIVYKNTVDKNGNTVYGETYQLLYGVKLMFSGDNAALLDMLMSADSSSIKDTLDALSAAVAPDEEGNTNPLITHITDSVILRSVISIELIQVEGNTFYVPKAALEEVEGERVNLIIKDELRGLLENMDMLVEYVMFFEGDKTDWQDQIDAYLIENEKFYNLVKTNRIFEGTVASLFIAKLSGNSSIVIPNALKGHENIDGWITINRRQGELLNLLDALRKSKFSIANIILGTDDNKFNSANVLKKISSMEEGELEDFLSSKVLHYTVSSYVSKSDATVGGDFSLIVPRSCRQALPDEEDIDYLVKKSELISLFMGIKELGLYDDEDPSEEEEKDPEEGEEAPDEGVGGDTESTDDTTDTTGGSSDEGEGGNTGEGETGEGEEPGEGTEEPDPTDPTDPSEEPEEPEEPEKPAKKKTIDKVLIAIASDDSILEKSKILSASIVSTIVKNQTIAKDLPQLYDGEHMGSKDRLERYDSTNPWTEELPALIEALDELFGLSDPERNADFTVDGIDVSGTVKSILLKMNDEADVDKGKEEPRTKLGVLYDSVIFQNKITKAVDDVFASKVEAEVLSYAKIDGYYTKDELQKLCNAAKVLNVESFEDFKDFDFKSLDKDFFNEKVEGSEDTKLHVIYSSYIAKGLITKNVQETVEANDEVVDHQLAFESYLHVYRESEIEAVISVFGSLNAGKVNIREVAGFGHYFYHKDPETEKEEVPSYILVASASKKLLNLKMFVIPDTVYDYNNDFINPEELMLFMNALNKTLNDTNNEWPEDPEEWSDNTPVTIPAQDSRKDIFKSVIMRAKITNYILKLNGGSQLYVKEGNAEVVKDIRDAVYGGGQERAVISEAQLFALVAALETSGDSDGTFTLPTFDLGGITDICRNDSNRLYTLFESDIIRYRICAIINRISPLEQEDALDLASCEEGTRYTADADDVLQMSVFQ